MFTYRVRIYAADRTLDWSEEGYAADEAEAERLWRALERTSRKGASKIGCVVGSVRKGAIAMECVYVDGSSCDLFMCSHG